MDRTLVWAGVAIVGILTAAVTVLAFAGKDTSSIMTIVTVVVVPLLAALGFSKLQEVKQSSDTVRQQTNGQMTRMMDQNNEQMHRIMDMLARLTPSVPAAEQAPGSDTSPTIEMSTIPADTTRLP